MKYYTQKTVNQVLPNRTGVFKMPSGVYSSGITFPEKSSFRECTLLSDCIFTGAAFWENISFGECNSLFHCSIYLPARIGDHNILTCCSIGNGNRFGLYNTFSKCVFGAGNVFGGNNVFIDCHIGERAIFDGENIFEYNCMVDTPYIDRDGHTELERLI